MHPSHRSDQDDNLRLITGDELAELFGICRRTVYGWVHRGELPKPIVSGLWWKDDCIRHLKGIPKPGDAAEQELQMLFDELEADRKRDKPRFRGQHRAAIWKRIRALNQQFGKAVVGRLDAIGEAVQEHRTY